MIFYETGLQGAFILEIEPREDHRGFFARSFCVNEFKDHGLNPNISQCNLSWNEKKGTLRGMHYQQPPHAESKLIRCTRGSIFDVMIDLRPNSSTYCQWFGIELSAGNRKMLYVPEGFAHGYQTLQDDCEVFYMASEFYAPGSEGGVRWNDPVFKIAWPLPAPILSEKDNAHPDYQP